VTLNAASVVDLQYFLMDAARRYARTDGDLLARAAALDYALLLSSEQGDESIDDAAPLAGMIRDVMSAAASSALDLVQEIVAGPDPPFRDFAERYGAPGGIFDVVRDLRSAQAIVDDGIAFRLVTLASEITERRRRI
jgi:hypothetical protein